MKIDRTNLRMTTTFLIFLLIGFFSFQPSNAYTGGDQHSGKKHKKHSKYEHDRNSKECGESPFSTEIISVEPDGECYVYEVKVTTSYQACSFELSHFMFDPGCGTISEAHNSGGWKMELNVTDPKTEVSGLKVDDISGFGKNPWFNSFYVKFKVCPDGSCEGDLSCASPSVAYKAGQCIYYEEFELECADPASEFAAEFEKTNPTCFNGQDGSIALNINGGEKPYSIAWNSGQTDSTISNLSAGDYTYMITDANGATLEHTITLESPDEILIMEEVIDPICSGEQTGSITLAITGGTGNYSYQWNTNDTTAEIVDKGAGNYSVVVTDEKGCTAGKSYALESQTTLYIEPYITQPTCSDESFGSIELEIMGGSEPYSFNWTDGSTEQNRYDLAEGNYQLTITDQNGCQESVSYVIKKTSPINISTIVEHTNCLNEPIGSIELFLTGGAEPYIFDWSNGETSQNLSGLTAGKYSVDVTDDNGCTASYDINIIVSELVLYVNQTSIPECSGDASASVDLTVFFGEPPYSYDWSNGATTEDLEGITAGTYSVIVTDALGCSATRYIEVRDQNPIEINYEVQVNGCAEAPEYEVSASVTGGDGNYNYLWSSGETSSSAVYTEPGVYSLQIIDGNGCTQSIDVNVEGEPGSPSCLINELTSEVMCSSEGNGLSTTIEGAISYDWKVNSTDGSWVITSSNNQAEITFTAGTENSSATFYLEILLESGCTAICVLDVSACTIDSTPENPEEDNENPDEEGDNPDDVNENPNDDGENPDDGNENPDDEGDNPDDGNENPDDDGENPDDGNENPDDDGENPDDGNENPDDDGDNPDDGNDSEDNGDGEDDETNDKDCTDCFYASDVEIVKNGNYFDYTVKVNHNGGCNYDLSHLVISIPECAWVKDYSNSMGWKMEQVYLDHKTGASGLKVDDIPSFGKDGLFTSFEIKFTLKPLDDDCIETLRCYSPEIAYKAGMCVHYEQSASNCAENTGDQTDIITYPNPTHDWVKVCFDKNDSDHNYAIDLYDMYGKKVHHQDRKTGGDDANCEINLNNYSGSIFYLHVTRKDGYLKTFKLCKK